MPLYEYKCENGHVTERVVIRVGKGEPKEKIYCGLGQCGLMAELVPSRTGTPILKRGIGGFYKPNAP